MYRRKQTRLRGDTARKHLASGHERHTLEANGGKVHGKRGSVQLLGIYPSTLRNQMNQFRLYFDQDFSLRSQGQAASQSGHTPCPPRKRAS